MPEKIDLPRWKLRLSNAHKRHDDKVKKQLKVWRDYYRGVQWDPDLLAPNGPYRTATIDNMVFSNISTIKPSINLRRPKVLVSPKKRPHKLPDGTLFNTIASASMLRLLLDSHYQELRTKEQTDKCLVDALIGHWGLMEFGYTFKTEKVKDKTLLEVHELIKEDSIFAVRRSPMDLRVDPKAKDHNLRDADWIALRWARSLYDVQHDAKFKNTSDLIANHRIDVDPTSESIASEMNSTEEPVADGGTPNDLNLVVGWRIWDKKHGKVIDIVETHDKVLQEGPWPLDFGGGFPIETLWFNYNPDELLPISDVDTYIAAQDELNRINSMKLDHIRRISKRAYIAQDGTFTNEEIEKLQTGPDGIVMLSNKSPIGALEPIKDVNIAQDIYIVGSTVKSSIRQTAGVSGFEAGESKNFDTATEPSLINEGVKSRRSERSVIIEDFHARIVNKMAVMLQQTLSKRELNLNKEQFDFASQTVPNALDRQQVDVNQVQQFTGVPHKVVGRVGDQAQVLLPWLTVDKKQIVGEYNFDIEVGSTQLDTEDKKKAEAILLYNTLQANPIVNPFVGTKKLLDAFQVPEAEELLKPQQQVQQERQQAVQTAVQGEQAKDQPKRDTDLQKTKMKSQVAMEGIKSKERIEAQKVKSSLLTSVLSSRGKQ